MKKIILLTLLLVGGLFYTTNAYAVQINPNVTIENANTEYITVPAIAVSSFNVTANHIFLGTRYFDLNSTAGKVGADIEEFSENNDISIEITNSSFTDVKMFVLTNQVQNVQIDESLVPFNSGWKYVDGNTITEIDVNSGKNVFISFNPPPVPSGGGAGSTSCTDCGGVPNPPPVQFCDLNPNDPSCTISQPLPSNLDLKITANPVTANIGQTVNTSLDATWTFPDDLTVNSMGASQYGWVSFPATPYTLAYSTKGTDYTIPITLHIPSAVCSQTVTQNCVTPDTTYNIPIKINGQFYQANFGYTTYIPVTIQKLPVSNEWVIILMVVAVVIVAVIIASTGRKQARSSGRQKEGTFMKNVQKVRRR